jgi:acyl-CoA synthetase (AMP-forming)/AMP-acid ligase II
MQIDDRPVLRWLDEPDPERGLHFAGPGEQWERWSYPDLAELTLRVTAGLGARGLERAAVVAVIQRSSPGFVSTYFGAIAAGMTACSIPPPFAVQRAEEYADKVTHLLDTARPALIVCDAESLERVRPIAAGLGLPAPVAFDDLVSGIAPAPGPAAPAEMAMLQFTSGSSGYSRGVWIPNTALQANVTAMRRWLDWPDERSVISWLPVHHDMGLVGALINIVVSRSNGWLMQPDDFIRSPLRYLTCMSAQRVSMSVMPNFGMAYILRRVRPAMLEGLRFDALRSVILGAERNDPHILKAFHELLEPFGFERRMLRPAYGGAEATLAVTGLPMDEEWTTATPVRTDGGPGEAPGEPIVGCGSPLEGVKLTIVDDDGLPVPDGHIGEIVVSGPSLAAGYSGDPGTASGTSLGDGTLRTGDAAFLRDGRLYVLGRLGDGLKIRGMMVFAESLEAKLTGHGIPERRCAVLLGIRDGVPTAVAVLDTPKPGWPEAAAAVLREAVGDEAEAHIVPVRRGGVAVTSSGKPRRRVMWRDFCNGALTDRVGDDDESDDSRRRP